MKKIYLAIPYTGIEESSYIQANEATALILQLGHNPFSPITHSHPLTDFGTPGNWEFWSKIDKDWIDVCDEVWVVIPREGIDFVWDSTGVQAEIEYAEEKGLPVRAIDISTGLVDIVNVGLKKPENVTTSR